MHRPEPATHTGTAVSDPPTRSPFPPPLSFPKRAQKSPILIANALNNSLVDETQARVTHGTWSIKVVSARIGGPTPV
jgi:hypothetical protein